MQSFIEEAVNKALKTGKPIPKKTLQEISNYLSRTVHHSWSIDDVQAALDDYEEFEGKTLTDEQCLDILSDFERYSDAENGMTWEGLRFHITEFFEELEDESKKLNT
jgi:hypothetical protein